MQKFSRSLLFAGVMAFGVLTACEGDTIVQGDTGVQSISVTPPTATINVGESIVLAASVTADAATAKTVTWSSSSAATATVDATGKVTGVKAGNVTITATSTADPSKAAAASVTVNAGPVVVNPSIAINSVTQGGAPANLLGAAGQLDVTVNTSGGGLIEAFLSTNCTTNTIGATETPVASQQATSAQPGTVTLSFNTAQLTAAGAPRFPNAAYCIKTRLTNGATVVVATNTVPITLANVSSYSAALTFTSRTGGPTSAVSDINGLSYNQGDLSVRISSINFASASPVALISGYLRLDGVRGSTLVTDERVTFTNLAVTAGSATIAFSDTVGGIINNFTSLPTGVSVVITAATDAAGNSVFTGTAASGVRIDNQAPPTLGGQGITAANGYLAAAYSFASGNTPTTADSIAGVPGVGGVTITYYSGPATGAAFTTANSCDVTGLTAATTAAGLPNTVLATDFRAKVVIADKLGNKVCKDVNVTTVNGIVTVFGVDKIVPIIGDTLVGGNTPAGVAKNLTGYTTGQNFTFTLNDSISGFDISPLVGTVIKDFTAQGAFTTSANCIEGKYDATAKTCTAQDTGFVNAFLVPTSIGYYTFTAAARDQAGNLSAVKTSLIAVDPLGPSLGALTQSPNPTPSLKPVTLSGPATDDLDLVSTSGWVSYGANLPAGSAMFQAVAGTSWTAFDATLTKTATASVTLKDSTIFHSLQTAVSGVIQGNAVGPTGNMNVKDVGGTNSATSSTAIVTDSAVANNVWSAGGAFKLVLEGSNPSARATSTTLTVRVSGPSTDVPFQSQPFAYVQIYRATGGALVPVGARVTGAVSSLDGSTTPPTRIYTWTLGSIPLGTGAAGTYNYYAVAVTSGGRAVISELKAIVNP